ncbi:hypothetical protein EVJ50_04175 [Synechococcus sp. RSCCF101]|uniref:hypothetical protein n=1 Tax=Synechococcus sp. RSCCF101 TaxID=2511069 RepID=UPI0012488D0B|nr:hypothetical protein [Synechococcus sp. RSCCF101]QEY31570.1 hypothetical protein EVJ50_04175 [Synechococcus sp. RSCCF101]
MDDRLFPAALDLARQKGLINSDRMPDAEHSYSTKSSFVLRDDDSEMIARVPLRAVRRLADQRQTLLVSILTEMEDNLGPSPSKDAQRSYLRKQSKEKRAVVWAISSGRRLPQGEPFTRRKLLITLLLLLLGVIPGLVYGVFQLYRANMYAQNFTGLVARWRRAGSPLPFEDLFALTRS